MNLDKWYSAKLKKLNWTDMFFVKLSVAAFVLMVAKLWSPLLSLAWYWYGLIAVVSCAWVCMKVFGK